MIQFIRGTTSENDGYTGPAGSMSVDTQLNNIRLHDGSTPGGFTIASIDDDGTIQSVDANAPLRVTGTTENPVIEIQSATTSQDGYMSKEDKQTIDGLGSASKKATEDFATAAQGNKADKAEGWGDHSKAGYENNSNKGSNNGYAGLDSSGNVPESQLQEASKSNSGIVSIGSQTFSGEKTFKGNINVDFGGI